MSSKLCTNSKTLKILLKQIKTLVYFQVQNNGEIDNQLKVMESQARNRKINAGRWTRAEHEKFMDALEKYGRDWVKIEKKIKTRTILQIRSHAQKVFLNMSECDIRAFIGIDDDSTFNLQQFRQECFEKEDLKNLKVNGENKKKLRAERKKGKLQNQSECGGAPTQCISEILNDDAGDKFFQNRSPAVIVSQVSNQKTNETTCGNQKNDHSFFLQLFKQNEKYFLNGGDFFGLVSSTQPTLVPIMLAQSC